MHFFILKVAVGQLTDTNYIGSHGLITHQPLMKMKVNEKKAYILITQGKNTPVLPNYFPTSNYGAGIDFHQSIIYKMGKKCTACISLKLALRLVIVSPRQFNF